MARRVFFSFHYADIMNANIVRMSGQFKPTEETGFYDASLWEDAKTKGDDAIQRLIDKGLNNTSVTCFLLGEHTYSRKWCKYELRKSLADRKGVLGILLPNQKKHGPEWISKYGKVYKWNHNKFANWVEQAAKKALEKKTAALLAGIFKLKRRRP
ncbi:MAG TPA: TIR domain-containing protein [Sedimentisphaerales bacterium]|nr:TIR domain-containing protein [Sedimentisphaerales bacterium]